MIGRSEFDPPRNTPDPVDWTTVSWWALLLAFAVTVLVGVIVLAVAR